ncbi:MAG: hypothetical protein HRT44_01890 [Bdellovibrionales bacterium]|nr:hypothetical protein [Bdellovibrionales bacterium]
MKISERFYAQLEMAKAGALNFAGLGRLPNGDYVPVIPLHWPLGVLSNYKVGKRAAMELFSQLDLLANSDIPWIKQSFDWQAASQIYLSVDSLVQVGDVGRQNMRIIGFYEAGSRPWEVGYRDGDFIASARQNNPEHPFSMANILKFSIFQNVPYAEKISFLNERIREGHLREAFTLIYFDLRFPERHNFDIYMQGLMESLPGRQRFTEDDFWSRSTFEARADDNARIDTNGWVSGKSLKQHFRKHGPEFGVRTKEEYLELAAEFFKMGEDPSLFIKQQGSGRYFKYNFETNEVGVLSPDFKIITYYRLNRSFRPQREFEGSLADQLLD